MAGPPTGKSERGDGDGDGGGDGWIVGRADVCSGDQAKAMESKRVD